MKYVGLDVHIKATVWCCLDGEGEIVERGKVGTTARELEDLARRLGPEVVFGQEAGKMSYFVHDVLTAAGARLLTFNAHHLRMIAASRKKTDRRDAYWIAKTLQTGMMPHPVFIPTGEVRELRRFPNARALTSYAGLVPSVRQSAESTRTGGITKEGSTMLRRVLVQAGHVLLWKCQSERAAPLRALAARVHAGRGRRKIAVVAAARHLLKIAYYVLRDGTSYDPTLLRPPRLEATNGRMVTPGFRRGVRRSIRKSSTRWQPVRARRNSNRSP